MSKITLTPLVNLQNETTAVNAINNNSDAIELAMENTLSRDGTNPNTMGASLDMNSNRVLNLPQPATAAEPLRFQDLNDFIGGGTITNIPAGGLSGQLLVKNSSTNYDIKWGDQDDSLVAGTNVAITGTTPATISVIPAPSFTDITDTGLTASQSVQTDGTKKLVSLANTGTGNNVLATSPTLVTPALGTPSAVVLTNATGLPITTGVSGLGTNVSTFLATPSSANLASALTDETGSGASVFATSPTLVTPILGTPTSGTLTNCTGLPVATGISGLGTGVATFLATPSSANLASAVTGETGTGALVFGTAPTISTPAIIGVTDGSSATAGNYGEYVESVIASGSAISLTSNVAANLTSISLTAGDWDVTMIGQFVSAATTSATQYLCSISSTSATLDTTNGRFASHNDQAFANGGLTQSEQVPLCRFNLTGTTTIYAVVRSIFTVSTMTCYGILRARRIR